MENKLRNGITEYFEGVELTEEYSGCFCSVTYAITMLGGICGLKNMVYTVDDPTKPCRFCCIKFCEVPI